MLQLFIEAFVVGIVLVIIGSLVGRVSGSSQDTPEECKDWNKNYIMEISLFLTGFLTHLAFEAAGANKWYCRNGYACAE